MVAIVKPARAWTTIATVAAILTISSTSLTMCAEAGSEIASGGGFSLVKGTLSGSGGASSGGDFTAQSTTSQPDAGEVGGGTFEVSGSFGEGDPADCVALTEAIGVDATETFCSGVRVTWGDITEHETGYRIFRDGAPFAITPANATFFDDSTAVPGAVYPYHVVTTNSCGDANPSNIDTGHRPLDPVSPTDLGVSELQEEVPDSVVVDLTWMDHSPDEARQVVYLLGAKPTVVAVLPKDVESARVRVPFNGPGYYCFSIAAENCGVEALGDSACTPFVVTVGEGLPPPTVFSLGPVVPNPFNPHARIVFQVPRRSNVRLRVLDVTGRLVRTLEDRVVPPGRYSALWNGTNESQHRVASGVYFVEMVGPSFRKSVRMVLLK